MATDQGADQGDGSFGWLPTNQPRGTVFWLVFNQENRPPLVVVLGCFRPREPSPWSWPLVGLGHGQKNRPLGCPWLLGLFNKQVVICVDLCYLVEDK